MFPGRFFISLDCPSCDEKVLAYFAGILESQDRAVGLVYKGVHNGTEVQVSFIERDAVEEDSIRELRLNTLGQGHIEKSITIK